MTYTIEIHYQTGDSFGSHQERESVGCVWHDKEQARLALAYIKDHYEVYTKANGWNPKYKTAKEVEAIVKTKPWKADELEYWEYSIKVPFEDTTQVIRAFWTGYFERLIEAKIITVEDDEDSFRPE